MSYYTDYKKEQILDKIIPLLFKNRNFDISLKEISAVTGIVSPVLYNYFAGVKEVNEEAYNRINSRIFELSKIKLPASIPAYLVAVTTAFNVIEFFENSKIPTVILTGPENNRINIKPLKDKFENLFSQIKGLKQDPVFSVIILFHQIAACVDYSRIINKPVPEDTAEKIFKTIL